MRYVFVVGAALSMIGSFLYVAVHYHYGLHMIAASNFFLLWYAINAICEYCRIMLLPYRAESGE